MDEHERQQGLLSQASEQLELAIVTLMDVIVAKSDQLRSEVSLQSEGVAYQGEKHIFTYQ